MKPRARTMVLWCPDWSVAAATVEAGLPADQPAAVLANNVVTVCNQAARADGVRRGMRRRDAQARCPELALLDHCAERDARCFEPVLVVVEQLCAQVAPLRPGLLAVASPAGYYGDDRAAAGVLVEHLATIGVLEVHCGCADDLFTAEQAARRAAAGDCLVVPPGGSPVFVSELPVEALDEPALVGLLRRLGIRTLGALAKLPARDVKARFGDYGARIHQLARGEDPSLLTARTPPPELTCQVRFEPPLESIEAVGFSVRRTAERFVAQLAARQQVCTRVHLEAEIDGRVVSGRTWTHVRWFSADDLVDRLRWQLAATAGLTTDPQREHGGVDAVRFVPEVVEAAGADGLWGGGAEEEVERGVARVQALLGYDQVVVPALQGGRSPGDRQAWIPWGERPSGLRPRGLPWPGSIPPPAPVLVLEQPWPAEVLDGSGTMAWVSDRGALSGEPARFRPRPDTAWQPVLAWAGPWPVEERWWENGSRKLTRFQVVGADGRAWLMLCDRGRWWTEAGYD
ncbi:MAG: DNA polymerase Y family protein [Nocardioidaceae bacterium]